MSEHTFDPEATIAAVEWRSSRVAAKYEHWYWVQPATDPEAFLALVDLIRTEGEPGQFARTRYFYLTISGWTYWVSRSAFPPYGLIVNRRRADHDQGDGSTFAQDWNEGLDDAEPHEQARLPL
jgi:hypothetical protein